MCTVYPMSSCSVSSLICCKFCFFLSLIHRILLPVFVPSPFPSSSTSLPAHVEPPAAFASKHHPPTATTPMPARVCPSLSVLTAPPTNLPAQHGFRASIQYCLIISADTREAGHYETSVTPPWLESQGLPMKFIGDQIRPKVPSDWINTSNSECLSLAFAVHTFAVCDPHRM